jgi:hypothetical protein
MSDAALTSNAVTLAGLLASAVSLAGLLAVLLLGQPLLAALLLPLGMAYRYVITHRMIDMRMCCMTIADDCWQSLTIGASSDNRWPCVLCTNMYIGDKALSNW